MIKVPPKKRIIRTYLPPREAAICARVREVRNYFGFTQTKFASHLEITRAALASYEDGRAPIKAHFALKLCRHFIFSEEWLATGKHSACRAEALRRRIKPGPGMEVMDREIFLRQCMDLFSEPLALKIAPSTLFSEAYDQVLGHRYNELVRQWFYLPRISLTDSDDPQMALNFLEAINKRYFRLLGNEALNRKLIPSAAWRPYTRCVFEASYLAFTKLMGDPTAKLPSLSEKEKGFLVRIPDMEMGTNN